MAGKRKSQNQKSVDNSFKNPLTQKPVARTEEQAEALKSIHHNTVTFIYGSPGTGKTHMATLMGLYGLLHNKYERIIMTRPCVEACGENLGYLPGDLDSKIMPYLLPIQEMMGERLEKGFFNKLRQEEKIKAIPLAFQRGMNFKNAYVIADEMQNTNPLQMRLLLTRICEGTKVVLTGDLAQTDARGLNGLTDAINRFQGVDDIGIVKMTEKSIVRHPIVQKVEEAYKKDDEL